MATNQADIPVIIQGAVNPPINQNQQSVVGGQTDPKSYQSELSRILVAYKLTVEYC